MTDSARERLKSWQASSSDASLLKCRLWFEVSLVLVPIIRGVTQRRLEPELRNQESSKSPLFLLLGISRTLPLAPNPAMRFMGRCFSTLFEDLVILGKWFEDELCTLHCSNTLPVLYYICFCSRIWLHYMPCLLQANDLQ